MRLTFVSSHAQHGGSERYLERLLSALGPSWVASVVVLEDGPMVARLRATGWTPVVVPTSASKLSMVRAARQLRRHVGHVGAELVHANGVKAALVATLAGVPTVWVKHDHSRDGWLARFVGRRCREVIGVSEAVLRTFPSSVRTSVVHTGVRVPTIDRDAARAKVRELAGGSPVVTLVGRFDPVKGHEDAITAVPDDAKLLFAGEEDPSHHAFAETLRAAAGGLAEFAEGRDDVTDLIAGSDVLVVPSASEGFGLAAVEAMALGTPVVAYASGALPEVIGDAGVLVPSGDFTALRDALERVLGDAALATRLSAAGRERAATMFSVDRWVESMRKRYLASRTIAP